ncbi:hypothetical protein CGI04_18195 [Vibrio parahaemolyticus]|nr:hypothetical protein [Vibrio parahaemolyticus]EGR3273813.1 hypothetical protein [Vibrio parahaemolyticus]EGR3304728.1 hypothetical protein [Vibrio parahaemolyticus]TOL14932.1 hypothetical protein CGI04_18195 [Vibrio parahaemolyticus]TOM55600.1 hypothetical protein CGH74_22825 [Vibrio parahaemolyticus]
MDIRLLYTAKEKLASSFRSLKFNFWPTLLGWIWRGGLCLFKVLIGLMAHPIFTFIIVFMQLILGALLGAQFGSTFQNTSVNNSGLWNLLQDLWTNLTPPVQGIAIGVVVLSLIKGFADAVQSFREKRTDKQRIEQEHLVPSGQYFVTTYADTVREVLNDRYLIDSKDKEPLDVIRDSLTQVRKLASEYEDLSKDTISINLMLSMRTDESEEHVAKNWEDIHMFFDGASAKAACAQIDGVLIPIAVAHKTDTNLYIGQGRINKNPLLLPIVEGNDSKTKTQQRVIGAPTAFSTNHQQYYPNFLHSVEDWLFREQKRYINNEQAELLYKYYVDDGSARSLLSIPISSVYEQVDEHEAELEGKTTTLVMNIYARHENLLRGNPTVFIGLAQPLLDTISYALDKWMLNVNAMQTDSEEENAASGNEPEDEAKTEGNDSDLALTYTS